MSKYLFLISHPAHFHMFLLTMKNLENDGHSITIVIRPKDVLEQLCINSGLKFYKLTSRPKRFGMLGLGIALIQKTIEIDRIVKKVKPDILIGSDGVLAIVGKLHNIPAFECYEDDVDAIKLYANIFFPLYTRVICPDCCSAGKWENKKTGYKSYHELGYLHPNQFTPDESKVSQYGINPHSTFFVIRFAKLTAHHDVGINGISDEIAGKIIELLKPHGRIIITSERELIPDFEQYRIAINPLDMHHIMYYASMFIGDSQTMSAEAGVLGVPFVHFNDFVGRLSYINELEQKYRIGFGHKTDDPEGMLKSIRVWLSEPDRKGICQKRRDLMLSEKIDYSKFLTWYIENWPQSVEIMKKTPEYQLEFK